MKNVENLERRDEDASKSKDAAAAANEREKRSPYQFKSGAIYDGQWIGMTN